MDQLIDVLGLVAVATLFGSMVFFSAVVAPLIFIKLDASTAGSFVRAIFPWYYLVIGVLSVVAVAALFANPINAAVMILIAISAFVSRQILVPRINHHRDRMLDGVASAEQPFTRLHRLSVWINGAQLFGAAVVLVRLALQ